MLLPQRASATSTPLTLSPIDAKHHPDSETVITDVRRVAHENVSQGLKTLDPFQSPIPSC